MISCVIWGSGTSVASLAKLPRRKAGIIAVWRRKQIPLHASWRAGSAGTPFFSSGERSQPDDSGNDVELMIRPGWAKIVQIERGIAASRRNPSSAISLPGVLLEPAAPARVLNPYRATAVASATSNAVMLTIRRTVADAVSTCTG